MAGGSTGASDRGGGEFVLKPWELHGEGREFEKLGGQLTKAVAALERDLAALGAPWGTDLPGSGFAAVYGPAHGELVGGLRGLAGRVGKVGAGLHTMAERTADADTSAASGFGAGTGVEGGGGAVVVPAVAPARTTTGATPGAAPAVPKDMSV
ncbi:hypothetical protein ATKI12_2231 [Kitasatospora sp. Ki12]|uniref:hypothetical protein n=1 Tax=Kitasatospora xanthocidica TaxID=83382 RepID=UPI0016730C25|nr:hypothetical protein [Kitasatospora xanthocidica]GHF47093.1 hypothetical protein GCM10018790_25790 [Kitasatospora xanthocidica]